MLPTPFLDPRFSRVDWPQPWGKLIPSILPFRSGSRTWRGGALRSHPIQEFAKFMTLPQSQELDDDQVSVALSDEWGGSSSVSRYLKRCRVDTPITLVEAIWARAHEARESVGKVVDFGAGDGRFSTKGSFEEYVGYEIAQSLWKDSILPDNAKIVPQCAFSDTICDADLCIGNPPYVRNQDLPPKWRRSVSTLLKDRTGVSISGLANAWQYFFLLALASTNETGLCALLVPYEWVSRPSARALRAYIRNRRWNVKVYRLLDKVFNSVLTTSSITIVDKALLDGSWTYYKQTSDGSYELLDSPSGAQDGVLPFIKKADISQGAPIARRGLSPGTQKVLTLTEGERVRNGLGAKEDVVPCVTSLRSIPIETTNLNREVFRQFYVDAGLKCWLLRTDKMPSTALSGYLQSVPESAYQTITCLARDEWWNFDMPPIPNLLVAQGFRGKFPKAVINDVGARAVGGVCGIYNSSKALGLRITEGLGGVDLRERIVAYANGLRKIEINQLNYLLAREVQAATDDG